MKAIRAHAFGDASQLRLDEIAAPAPGPGEALVTIRAAGVNPADTYMLSGNYALRPDLPYIPGGDAAGVVAAVGEGVASLAPGDRVVISAALSKALSGCYAEAATRPAGDLMKLPDTLDFEQGASLGIPYTTAHFALFTRGRARAGETLFIHGASGAVGTAAIQLAKRAGLTVIGSAGTAEGLAHIRAQGVDHAVDHTAAGYLDAVRAATGGEGPALILEMLANVNLAADMELAAKFGRIVIIGCRGDIPISPRVAMMKELDILGTAIWNATREEAAAALADILAAAAEGALVPVVGRRFPLSKAAEAQRAVLAPGAMGKIVLTP